MVDLINLVGSLGMPVVAAGVVLWLYVRQERRTAEREDMLLSTLIHGKRGENGDRASGLKEIGEQLDKLADVVASLQETIESRPCVQREGECIEIFVEQEEREEASA